MSNRRKRKQARKQARREESKTRQAELVNRRMEIAKETILDSVPNHPIFLDEWDDFDEDRDERVARERNRKNKRQQKYAEDEDRAA